MNSLQKQWSIVGPIMVPADAPAAQQEQSKLCFYAGAEAVLRVMFDIGGKDVSEAAGVMILEGMHQEVRRFSREQATRKGLPQALIDAIVPAEKSGTSQ